ncbi:hypothetical protein CS542_00140 [Pedobacter sp. IW39]|nr:hypothetical protein CS542_00140 [Pedobacter sp. IW39]
MMDNLAGFKNEKGESLLIHIILMIAGEDSLTHQKEFGVVRMLEKNEFKYPLGLFLLILNSWFLIKQAL